jgi:hypothetical protein
VSPLLAALVAAFVGDAGGIGKTSAMQRHGLSSRTCVTVPADGGAREWYVEIYVIRRGEWGGESRPWRALLDAPSSSLLLNGTNASDITCISVGFRQLIL